jgi:hypothetical protein
MAGGRNGRDRGHRRVVAGAARRVVGSAGRRRQHHFRGRLRGRDVAFNADSNPASAGVTVAALFRAEACKILVIILQLWLVLVNYKEVVFVAFFASFVITVLMFRMALLDKKN